MSEDKEMYLRLVDACLEIKKDRQTIYSDNWRYMPIEVLLMAAAYKCWRAALTHNHDKQVDDVIDAVNYLVFTFEKLRDDNNGE